MLQMLTNKLRWTSSAVFNLKYWVTSVTCYIWLWSQKELKYLILFQIIKTSWYESTVVKVDNIYIYIYAFSRRFYPKRLTVHSGYTCFITMCVPWESNPQPFALLTQCSTTEPQEHNIISLAKKTTAQQDFIQQNKLQKVSNLQSGAWSKVWETRQRSWVIAGRLCSLCP